MILPLCMVQSLHCVYVPLAHVYPSILLVNHIRGTVFKLLYINISNDSPYFRCPDEGWFYPFEILDDEGSSTPYGYWLRYWHTKLGKV